MSRLFISGFLMGFGISTVCHSLYLIYIGKKLKKIAEEMTTTNKITTSTIELDVFPEEQSNDDYETD
jgi:hypothetical protein